MSTRANAFIARSVGIVTIALPSHTFSEYFTNFVLGRFELLAFEEGKEAVPMWFLAELRKR